MSNPPVDVQQFGQSIWLDFIHRRSIEGGELQKYIDDYGVIGVTSNRSEERRVGKECRSRCDWSSDVCSSDLFGQSIWLDFIHRRSIEGGELQKYIDDYGVIGVTSN